MLKTGRYVWVSVIRETVPDSMELSTTRWFPTEFHAHEYIKDRPYLAVKCLVICEDFIHAADAKEVI